MGKKRSSPNAKAAVENVYEEEGFQNTKLVRRSTRLKTQQTKHLNGNNKGAKEDLDLKPAGKTDRKPKRKGKIQPEVDLEAKKPKVEASGTEYCKENIETQKDSSKSHSRMEKYRKMIGAHVSVAGGLHNAISNAVDIGAKSFALFLRNQRQWNSKPLEDNDAELFIKACKEADFSPDFILPHGIYLVNCASPDDETFNKSKLTLVDELKRCEKLGLKLYNFHLGSTCGKITVEEGIERIARSINDAHKETKSVVTLIENMCCQGNTIGGKFEELKAIIDKIEDKTRIGVCFDTCHAFAAGYDISTKEAFDHTMEIFEDVIGLKYLRAVHLNDSKGNCGCKLDRHENIGHGKIGTRGFKALMNDNRFDNIPMVLETPETDYAKEIHKLYAMINK